MGKIVTLYLTDEEASELKDFCDENRCTQYSALKTALRELLNKPIKKMEEEQVDNRLEEKDDVEENTQSKEKPVSIKSLLERLIASRQTE